MEAKRRAGSQLYSLCHLIILRERCRQILNEISFNDLVSRDKVIAAAAEGYRGAPRAAACTGFQTAPGGSTVYTSRATWHEAIE
jgi:hypothetical protein